MLLFVPIGFLVTLHHILEMTQKRSRLIFVFIFKLIQHFICSHCSMTYIAKLHTLHMYKDDYEYNNQ